MPTLQDAFDFTDDDLAVNRLGRATSRQAQRLRRNGGCALSLVGASVITLVGLVGVVVLISFVMYLAGDTEPLEQFVVILLLASAFLPAVGFAALFFLDHRDRQDMRVAPVTGIVTIKRDALQRDSVYNHLEINGRRFSITLWQTRALRPYTGRLVTVYYFPRSRWIASLEPVDSPSDHVPVQ